MPKKTEKEISIDFLDAKSGLKLFNDLKETQEQPRFVASILVMIKNIKNTALNEFIRQLFNSENISFRLRDNYHNSETCLYIRDYDILQKEDINKLLNKCIILNTYLGYYFIPKEYLLGYEIYFRLDNYKDKGEMYKEYLNSKFEDVEDFNTILTFDNNLTNALYLDDSVIINTIASEKIKDVNYDRCKGYVKYNYIDTKLANSIDKEIS